jgi:hypothetical protein
VIAVGRDPDKMREALGVVRSAGFTATGTFDRESALAAIAAQDRLFAVVMGGFVDAELEVELRAAAEPTGAHMIRAFIGNDDPALYFQEHVLPQLEQLATQG